MIKAEKHKKLNTCTYYKRNISLVTPNSSINSLKHLILAMEKRFFKTKQLSNQLNGRKYQFCPKYFANTK